MNVLNDLRARLEVAPAASTHKRSVWEALSHKARGVLHAIKS